MSPLKGTRFQLSSPHHCCFSFFKSTSRQPLPKPPPLHPSASTSAESRPRGHFIFFRRSAVAADSRRSPDRLHPCHFGFALLFALSLLGTAPHPFAVRGMLWRGPPSLSGSCSRVVFNRRPSVSPPGVRLTPDRLCLFCPSCCC